MATGAGAEATGAWERIRAHRAVRWSPVAAFALLLLVPRPGSDGPRNLAPSEAEVPRCRPGHPCPDAGPAGWGARIEVVLEDRARALPEEVRREIARAAVEESIAAGIDPLLAAAMMAVESGFDAKARSRKGARGLMQLLPETREQEASRTGLVLGDPDDPVANVRLGVRYYRRLLDAFANEEHALMAYNAGPNFLGAAFVKRRVPQSVRAYAARVLGERERLRRSFGLEESGEIADVRFDLPPR